MATVHDNDFNLKIIGISDFSFDVTSYYITSGQPWDGVTTSSNSEGATITAKAGRKSSTDTAEWFKDAIGNGSAIGCQTIDKLPSKLNFAFMGTMSFSQGGKSFTGQEIVLAQGSTNGGRNNWWIGGPNMTTIIDLPAGVLSVISQDFSQGSFLKAKVLFTVAIGDVSSMSMGIVSV